jgi:uncharacterized membrane protein
MTKEDSKPRQQAANLSEKVDVWLASLLRGGTLLAAFVLLIAGAMYLARHGQDTPSYVTFHGEPRELKSIDGIVHSARTGNREALVMVGLLLLIATPIARVIGCVLAFVVERDLTYIVVSLVVLAGLLFGLVAS